MYDLYVCIGYKSDVQRSKIQLLAGMGHHTIKYSDIDSAESDAGIYTITNGNTANDADVYMISLDTVRR